MQLGDRNIYMFKPYQTEAGEVEKGKINTCTIHGQDFKSISQIHKLWSDPLKCQKQAELTQREDDASNRPEVGQQVQ